MSFFEINDAQAIFRGHFLAVDGQFSGTFASDMVNVADRINIRDGAVMSYYMAQWWWATNTQQWWQMTLPPLNGTYYVGFYSPLFITVDPDMYQSHPQHVRVYRNNVHIDTVSWPWQLGGAWDAIGAPWVNNRWESVPLIWGERMTLYSNTTFRFELDNLGMRTSAQNLPDGAGFGAPPWNPGAPIEQHNYFLWPNDPGYGAIMIWKR